MVAEIKKGRYVYYHCTGNRGKCAGPYAREELLDARFAKALGSLALDDEVVDWMTAALRQSHADEKRFHDEAIGRLQAEYQVLQQRLDGMYVDKLDGRIAAEFFERKSAEWRRRQSTILHSIEAHQQANQNYLEDGLRDAGARWSGSRPVLKP